MKQGKWLLCFRLQTTQNYLGSSDSSSFSTKTCCPFSVGVGCNLYMGSVANSSGFLCQISHYYHDISSPAKNSLIPWCWPPSLVTATTRIIPFLVGVSQKPSTVSGRDATPSWYPHLPIYLQLRRQEFVGQPQEFGRHGESEKSQGWITSDDHHLAIDTPHVEVPLKFTFEDLSLHKTRKKSSPFIDTHVKEPLLVNRKA